MDNRVVYFTTNNARVLVNPPNFEALSKLPNVAVNPDLTAVMGLPPHLWKLENGKVASMDEHERYARLAHLETHPVDNTVTEAIAIKKHLSYYWLLAAIPPLAYLIWYLTCTH